MKIIAIIGSQRSGTTALARTLSCAIPWSSYFGEIFHCDHEERLKSSNYFYWHQHVGPSTLFPFHSWDDAEDHCREYIHYLETLPKDANTSSLVIDIKYPTLSFIDWPWTMHYQRPPFFHTLYDHFESCLIHVYRDNMVDQYLSGLRASACGIWHDNYNEEPIRMAINKYDIEQHFNSMTAYRSKYSHLIERCSPNRAISLSYEQLFDTRNPTGLSPAMLDRLDGVLGDIQIRRDHLRPQVTKSSACEWIISNISELSDFFEGTVHARHFKQSQLIGKQWP